MPLTSEQQNAFDLMKGMLEQWNLGGLAQTVYDLLIQGYSQDNVSFLLKDTDAYKQRFSGNEVRRQKGLTVLSPAEYLSVESSYRQVMSNAGVPAGFWDQQSDFTKLIGNDTSPVELQRRVDSAQRVADTVTEGTAAWFKDNYGLDFTSLDRGALVAYVLDPDRGMNTIQSVLRGGTVANAARGRGLNISKDQAERFGLAASDTQVGQQSATFAELADRGAFLSGLYEGNYDLEKAGENVFMGDTAAEQERKRLAAKERGTFGGAGGVTDTSLGKGPGGF